MAIVEYLENAVKVTRMLDPDATMQAGVAVEIGNRLSHVLGLEDYEINYSMFKYPEIARKWVSKGYDKRQIAVIMNALDDNIVVDKYIETDFDSYYIYLIALAIALGEDPDCYRQYTKQVSIDPVLAQVTVDALCKSCCVLNIKDLDSYVHYVAEDYEPDDGDDYKPHDIGRATVSLLNCKDRIEEWLGINYPDIDIDLNVYTKVFVAVGMKYGDKKVKCVVKRDGIYGALQMLYSTGVWDKVKKDYPQYFMGEV